MGSSTCHLIFSTTPFLVLFCYFLYTAYNRPNLLQNAADNDEDVTIIPLMDILHTTLFTLIFWAWFAVYTGIFVSKRRRLMKSYLQQVIVGASEEEGGASTELIGNVYYDRPRGTFWKLINKLSFTDIAYVTYRHPEGNADDGSVRYVEKKIRTYHPYHRENVTILVLKDLPLSGQPKLDIERDVASFQSENAIRNRDKIKEVVYVSSAWAVFLFSSAIYIICQIQRVNNLNIQDEDDVEDPTLAWTYFYIYTCGIIPLIAIVGNLVQYIVHLRWVTKGGKETGALTKVVPNELQHDDFVTHEEAGRYIVMA